MNLMFAPIQKFAEFQGRARRTEYWLFALFCFLLFGALGAVFAAAAYSAGDGRLNGLSMMTMLLWGIAWVALIIPTIAVTIRRLHDAGFSGWWILLNLVPGGSLVVFVFTVLPGTPGDNRFGPDPRTAPTTAPAAGLVQ